MAEENKLTRVLEIAGALLRWWGFAVAGGALGLAAGISAYYFMPKTYEGTTTILVTPSQIPLDFARTAVGEDMSLRLNSLKETVLSRPFLLKLIDDVFTRPTSSDELERLIGRIRSRVEARVHAADERRGTGLIEVQYRDSNPDRAAIVANRLAAMFVDQNVLLRTAEARSSADTLQKLSEEIGKQLDKKEAEIADFRARHLYELSDHLPANLQLLSTRQTEYANAQRALESAQDQLTLLRAQQDRDAQLAGGGAAGGAVVEGSDPRLTRLGVLERDLEALRAKYTDEHPLVRATRHQIEELKASLKSSPAPGGAGQAASAATPLELEIQEKEQEIVRRQDELRRISADIQMYQNRVEATPRVEQELAQLSKGLDALKDQYQGYRRNYEQAHGNFRIAESRKGEQFEVMERASPPAFPVSPNRFQIYFVGIALGLAAAVGPLVLLKIARPTIDSEAGLRSLSADVRVLATIQQAHTPYFNRRLWWRRAANGAASLFGAAALAVAVLKFYRGG